MFRTIEKLQRQPVRVRKQVALFLSGVIVFVIAAVWIATFGEEANVTPPQAGVALKIDNDMTPFALFKDQWNDIRSAFLDNTDMEF